MSGILYIEDNEDDVTLLKHALNQAKVEVPLVLVRDGGRAIAYLNGEGEFADRTQHPLPDLVLLDIKLPFRDGFEVLKFIRTNPRTQNLKVLMLSSSGETQDVRRATELGISGYLVKSASMRQVVNTLRSQLGI